MQMTTDDELYRVDDIFLGPRGRTLWWHARYRAYGVGAVVFLPLLGAEVLMGLLGLWPVVFTLIATMFITDRVMQYVDHDRTVKSVLVTAWHEAHAPRPQHRRPAPPLRPTLDGIARIPEVPDVLPPTAAEPAALPSAALPAPRS